MKKGKAREKVGRKTAYITFVVDESGSMGNVREVTVSGINEQIQQVKRDFAGKNSEKVNAIVSLIRFNDKVKPVFMYSDIDALQEITLDEYKPDGGTAMYDAVGYAINQLKMREDIDEENTSSLIVVVSDGQENSSREITAQQLADMISVLNETKRWTVTYLGANQDLSKVSQSTNIYVGNTMSFSTQNPQNVSVAFSGCATALNNYAYVLVSGCTMTGELATASGMNNFYAYSQPIQSGPVSSSII